MTALGQTLLLGLGGGLLAALVIVAASGYANVWTAVLLTGLAFCF